jgi:toluene monooxygenase system ferredoxin subunit
MVNLTETRPAGTVELCAADELWDGEMACFRAGGAAVLLVKLDGRFHAYQARCPHQGVALAEGELEGGRLTCRAHGWQFDAVTGQGVNPRSAHLKRFPVHVAGRTVLIETEPDAACFAPQPCTQGADDAE